MDPFRLIIDGKKVPTKQCFEVLNPATEKVAGLAPLATREQLEDAIRAAKVAQKSWTKETERKRQTACRRIAERIEAHSEELAALLTAEQGKPMGGLGSRWEIGGAIAWTQYTASLSMPPKVLQDNNEGRVELFRKPIGVVGSILPWNFPVMIAIWHIIPAVLSGNTVVAKPSPYTPLTTLRLVELMNEVLPRGVVNCVTGDDDLGPAMTSHPDIGKIVFTGSSGTGKKIYANAAESMKRMTLELGGNDAGIVLPDVDPRQIAEGLFWGAFINTGQTCAALKRLYVHDDVYEDVCEELVKFARKMPMGEGTDETAMLGPMQNLRQFEIVSDLVADARKKGRVLLGGDPPARTGKKQGYFFPLTIIADLDNGDRLVDEEQFGPALPIIRFRDIDEVIEKANDNPNGLGGSVWSRNITTARQVASRMECGSVWINKHGMIQPNAPFGGVKQSGVGVEFGQEGLEEYTNIQVVFS
ncbi:aldehyde dehydrogenase family protein [Ruegeria sp. WL0004]|uniref:Aldehyde dehydrogenase family protein n=1 Tax=Ruegeria marisflavi TaxID=2984152 RepID=A0ABT2WXB9_9RHOB|nr:aldehyde dehydrogenase family protein [Ruegeria sp. WL0004]MCU9840337.1 aldehyde dehydrogenase family protein [Ruegeria sp. WL0004]